jgi:hypothetical protein
VLGCLAGGATSVVIERPHDRAVNNTPRAKHQRYIKNTQTAESMRGHPRPPRPPPVACLTRHVVCAASSDIPLVPLLRQHHFRLLCLLLLIIRLLLTWWPRAMARCRGVAPRLVLALTLAPLSRKACNAVYCRPPPPPPMPMPSSDSTPRLSTCRAGSQPKKAAACGHNT